MRHLPDTPAEMCGIAVNAGSRDEEPDRHGLAHFVEHTVFKGTGRRRAFHINNRMESVGGELNAYTTKEETFIYSTFPAGQRLLDRAAELIADLVMNSRFPDAEIEREREVVIDEIMSYLDSPSERVFDDFDDLIYCGSPLGHNILGSAESVGRLTPSQCRAWLDKLYTPGQMVFFYTGPLPPHKVERIAERRFGALSHPDTPRHRLTPPCVGRFDTARAIGSHQAHTVTGARIPGLDSERRIDLALAVNIAGGPGMNSLLNVELRERRGLVYSAEASSTMYTAGGLLSIYYGCDPEDAGRCHKLVLRTIERVADGSALSPRRFEMAAKQYLGQLNIAAENRESRILSAARSVLFRGGCATMNEVFENIHSVRREDVMTLAGELRVYYCELSLRPRS